MKCRSYLLGLMLMAAAPVALGQACGSLDNGYGPYDYTNGEHRRNRLKVVEDHHFTEQVERLRRGESGSIGGDLDYTLRAFPNHHRALDAMSRLAVREDARKPPRMRYTVDCWFQRAKEFASDDGMVWMLEGMHHHRLGDTERGIEAMRAGLERSPNNANIHYNLGLLYLDAGQPEQALSHAREAYERGFPLTGLRQRLQAAGHPLTAEE